MPYTKEEAKAKLSELVENFRKDWESGKAKEFNEEQTKKAYIEPFFECLNWNIRSPDEVSVEEKVSKGRVDYGFRIDGIPKFYVEAKASKEDLNNNTFAEQAINYSWFKSTTWAILTDFEELKVFNAEWESRNPRDKIYINLKYTDFIEKFDRIWLLSKDSFLKDELDREAEEYGKKIKKTLVTPVMKQIFNDLMVWREKLTKGISNYSNNRKIVKTEEELDEAVQRIIDRLIFIRVCEDRGIESIILQSKLREWLNDHKKDLVHILNEIFRDFDKGYDSRLFENHPSENLKIDNSILVGIINNLYESSDGIFKYDFGLIEADVLGNVYEEYLGYILQKNKKKSSVVENHTHRKEMGIYYTPTFIVECIIRNTLGEVLKQTKPEEMDEVRVLDMACGSGSFLLKAFDLLNRHHKDKLDFLTKVSILKNNIYGVDLDPKAVEIAQLNLLLKTLEKRKLLPKLQENLKIGNSLIEDATLSDRSFKWEQGFEEIIRGGGFDVVVGNPPYINAIQLSKTEGGEIKDYWKGRYSSARGAFDIYILFFEQALNVCKDGGYVSFITPNKYLSSPYGQAFREIILKNYTLVKIIDLSGVKVFKDPSVYPIITVIQKKKPKKEYMIETEKILSTNIYHKKTHHISSKSLDLMPEKNWGIVLSESSDLLKKIFEKNILLEKVAEVQATSTASEADTYSNLISESSGIPIVITGTIDRYSTTYGLVALKRKGKKIMKPLLNLNEKDISDNRKRLYRSPKIIFAKLALRPEAFLDYEGRYASINTNCVHSPKKGYDLKYLVGILNSKMMKFVYSEIFSGLKMGGGYFQFQAPQLRILPIADSSEEKKKNVVNLVDKIIRLNEKLKGINPDSDGGKKIQKDIDQVDKEIDQKVYDIYGLTKEEIKIVESN